MLIWRKRSKNQIDKFMIIWSSGRVFWGISKQREIISGPSFNRYWFWTPSVDWILEGTRKKKKKRIHNSCPWNCTGKKRKWQHKQQAKARTEVAGQAQRPLDCRMPNNPWTMRSLKIQTPKPGNVAHACSFNMERDWGRRRTSFQFHSGKLLRLFLYNFTVCTYTLWWTLVQPAVLCDMQGKRSPLGSPGRELFLCLDTRKLPRNAFHSSSAWLSVLKGSQCLGNMQRMYNWCWE